MFAGGWLTENGKLPRRTDLQASELAYPCGQVAKYRFSDKFTKLRSQNGSFEVVIDDTDIAHEVDREFKFKYNDKVKADGGYWTDIDEHLMVWY